MKLVTKRYAESAIQYNGNNLEEIRESLNDSAGQIQPYMDGMLKVDTQHGRLAIRVQEWIVKDDEKCYMVYSNNEFQQLYDEVYDSVPRTL